jgi:simple sugar transport system ATP-binding protein
VRREYLRLCVRKSLSTSVVNGVYTDDIVWWPSIGNAFSVEIMAAKGYDSLTVERIFSMGRWNTARTRDGVSLLELNGIVKRFGAIHALEGIDLSIKAGEAVGLMGDNGAGKSTLMKIIAGNFPPTEGSIRMGGAEVHFTRPLDARNSGIEIVYQDLALCDNLSAAANVFLGREIKRRFGPITYLDHKAMNQRAGELFRELKSETRPRDLVKQMSGGQRQAVAIARTRLSDPRLVLMDEPTAAISVRQVAEVLNLIHRLKETHHAVVLVSHRMPDVFAVCDRVAVLRRGTKVADKHITNTSPEEVTGLITGAIESA